MPVDETKRDVPMPKDRIEKAPMDRLRNEDAPEGAAAPDGRREEARG